MTEQNKLAAQMARGDYENTSQFSRLTRCAIAGTALGAAGYLVSSLVIGNFKPKPANIITGLGGILCGTLLGDLNLHSPTYEEQAEAMLRQTQRSTSQGTETAQKELLVRLQKERDSAAAFAMMGMIR